MDFVVFPFRFFFLALHPSHAHLPQSRVCTARPCRHGAQAAFRHFPDRGTGCGGADSGQVFGTDPSDAQTCRDSEEPARRGRGISTGASCIAHHPCGNFDRHRRSHSADELHALGAGKTWKSGLRLWNSRRLRRGACVYRSSESDPRFPVVTDAGGCPRPGDSRAGDAV